jgi:hypothetical protein
MNQFPERKWYLYDNTSGAVILKHPYWPKIEAKCPYCEKLLKIENYKAQCCAKFWGNSSS